MLDDFDLPLTELEQQLLAWVAEAMELRHGAAGDPDGSLVQPSAEAGLTELVNFLYRVRQRLDRVDGLLVRAILARGRAQRGSAVAKHAADDAWDQESARSRHSSVVRGPDYSGARERYADANLATLPSQRQARLAARLASVADDSLDVLRLTQRGLDGVRQDALALIRSRQWESHLER